MLRRNIERVKRRMRALAGLREARRQPNPLANAAKAIVTTFYDVEGDYAMPGQQRACADTVPRILEIEKRFGIRSTYNVVAKFAQDEPQVLQAIRRDGHEVASHSYDHQVLNRLPAHELVDNMRRTRRAFADLGVDVIGHRSPRSAWNSRVMRVLLEEGFAWSAENGREPHPYEKLRRGAAALWRFPVTDDDWYYERDGMREREVVERWQRIVRNAQAQRRYAAIGFHPWVQARPGRLTAFEEFMHWLSEQPGVEVRPFGELLRQLRAAPASLSRTG